MVLTIPFRQVLEIFPDRVKLRNLFRTYELLNILPELKSSSRA
jgi:hypothetical protein